MKKVIDFIQKWHPSLYLSLFHEMHGRVIHEERFNEQVLGELEIDIINMLDSGQKLYAIVKIDDTESPKFQDAWAAFESSLNKLIGGE